MAAKKPKKRRRASQTITITFSKRDLARLKRMRERLTRARKEMRAMLRESLKAEAREAKLLAQIE